jgi:hypothetical protein
VEPDSEDIEQAGDQIPRNESTIDDQEEPEVVITEETKPNQTHDYNPRASRARNYN